jgi:hypothetical protein
VFNNKDGIESALAALSEQLGETVANLEIVVCGGAALNILGYVNRTTIDVDIMAFVNQDRSLQKNCKIYNQLYRAAKRVQKDFNLPDNWLNTGPSDIIDLGVPEGLMERVKTFRYGKNLIVHFLDRYDQIHFKLYAATDNSRASVHYRDLLVLEPTEEEILKAAKWAMTHDVSEEFKLLLKDLLVNMGFKNASEKL